MTMVIKKLMIFCCVVVLISCDNKVRREKGRKSRFISFDTENNDVQVSLDFTVPFISIPVKKVVDSFLGGFPGLSIPKINFNPSALAFAGTMILASTVLLPLFSKGFSSFEMDRNYRVLDADYHETNFFMDLGNQLMSASRGCPLRIACWMSQRSNDGESRRTMEQIIRNKLVTSVINTTAIEEAIRTGRKGHDCLMFEPCPIREEYLPALMRKFDFMTNTRNTT